MQDVLHVGWIAHVAEVVQRNAAALHVRDVHFLGLRGLPVSVAAAASNSSVVVTVGLSAIFLHQPLSRARGAAIALTLLGATVPGLSTG